MDLFDELQLDREPHKRWRRLGDLQESRERSSERVRRILRDQEPRLEREDRER